MASLTLLLGELSAWTYFLRGSVCVLYLSVLSCPVKGGMGRGQIAADHCWDCLERVFVLKYNLRYSLPTLQFAHIKCTSMDFGILHFH